MEKIIIALMLVTLMCLWGLMFLGRRYIERAAAAPDLSHTRDWPPVSLIIPVAGRSPGLEDQLRSRLHQDYPNYEVILVTRSGEDPASEVIGRLLTEFPHARQVVSGPAQTCGQKNYNLLAGVRAASTGAKILVFADANQVAPKHWLAALVQPLVGGRAVVSSGFHHIIPRDRRLATQGRLCTVLMIYLGKGVPGWDQPWGGATALPREVFRSLELDELWSRTVVDDVTLAKRMQEAGIPATPAPGAVLATEAAESLASWEAWFTRQILYLKFYFFWPWLLAGVGLFTLLGLVLVSLGWIFGAAGGLAPGSRAAFGLVFLLGFSLFLLAGRTLHPAPGSWPSFLAAGYLTLAMAVWCHAKTWRGRKLCWRRLLYTVDRRGWVSSIQEL